LSNDHDPKFLSEFYLNLRILSQELYKKSTSTPTGRRMNVSSSASTLQTTAAAPAGLQSLFAQDNNNLGGYDHSNAAMTMIQEPSLVDHEEQIQGAADYFGPQRIQDRMRLYAQGAGFPMEFLDRYNEEKAQRKE
jgi:hypothetical protein